MRPLARACPSEQSLADSILPLFLEDLIALFAEGALRRNKSPSACPNRQKGSYLQVLQNY
jgi:hypothetical protein